MVWGQAREERDAGRGDPELRKWGLSFMGTPKSGGGEGHTGGGDESKVGEHWVFGSFAAL